MSLRLRMFLLIGVLFGVIFASAQVVESYIAKKYIELSRSQTVQDIQESNNVKQRVIENYLIDVIEYVQAQTNALLMRISENSFLIERYGPTKRNFEKQNWFSAAFLMGGNKELDFVQIINQKKVTSSILLPYAVHRIARKVPYGGPIPLFIMESNLIDGQMGPYIGIKFNGHSSLKNSPAPNIEIEDILLFEIPVVMNMDLNAIAAKIDQVEMEIILMELGIATLDGFKEMLHQLVVDLSKAQEFFRSRPDLLKELTSDQKVNWILKVMPDVNTVIKEDFALDLPSVFINTESRYQEIEMVGEYGMFLATGLFGSSPFDPLTPIGVTQIFASEDRGQMFYKNEVYLSEPLELNEPNPTVNNKKSFSQNSFQYFFEQGTDRFFFGNTAEFTIGEKGAEREGTVTVGVDATRILENLAIVSHRMAFFATDKKIVKGFTSDGKNLSPYFSLIPLDQILASKTGVVYAPDGEGYFFITLHPFPKMDFYFFLLNPVADEFALVNAIDKNATMILEKIKVQTQIVIVVALLIIIIIAHLLARRITKPILLLLGATAKVKEGQLDDIHLPPLKKKKMDEIETLYFSFFQMVEGLKEKEKVKGILDKVVSPTIAKEILEGHIHLGGEEKVVTVLFADIRKFSNLTEKMLPHEVIGMLNECMTRISEVIDAHGGVIDKYVGDEVMALFGAPVSSPNSPFEAVICALEIQKALENWNIERSRQKLPPIYMGIGVHTGVVLAGNMGAEKRLNYTVLGANVNLAARLCSAAHEGEILISADTLNEPGVKEGILYEASAPIELKGFSESISLFRVKGKK